MSRLLGRLLFFSLTVAVLAGVAYAFTDGFAQRWRAFVIQEFQNRGVYLDFARFGLGLSDGIIAREVRIFADADRKRVLVSMDRLNLDLDYGKLMEQQFFVDAVELSDATVTLPLAGEQEDVKDLELRNLNARLFMLDDRLEIRKAEGDLAGIHMVISGFLQLPAKEKDATDKGEGEDKVKSHDKAEDTDLSKMELVQSRRHDIRRALQWLERFQFGEKPVMTLDLEGKLQEPENMNARLTFLAKDIEHEGYLCKELAAKAEFRDHRLDVRQVIMRDAVGSFEGSASWPLDSEEISFQLTTTADLPKLARTFFRSNELREVVFYESSPPTLTLEGKWFVRGPKAGPKRPVEALGSLKFGRFTSRGEMFEGLAASIGVSPDGYYIRDGLLRHKTGTVSLQAMSRAGRGFQYRAVMKMSPHAFLPFVSEEKTRELIKRFEFNDASTILVQIEGQGTDATLDACKSTGRLELHDFKFSGLNFSTWSGNLELVNQKQIFSNVIMVPREGSAKAEKVVIDAETKTVQLTGVSGTLDPVPLTSCFARKTAEALVKYRFGPNTQVSLEGTVEYRPKGDANLKIQFAVPKGTATYPLWGKDYLIAEPAGTFVLRGPELEYEVKGQVFQGAMTAKGAVNLKPSGPWSVEFEADRFPYPIMGKNVALEQVKVTSGGQGKGAPFQVRARLLGGRMSLEGAAGVGHPDDYRGELKLDAISFEKFAAVYAPGNESQGDITGHFTFTGKRNDWKSLKGAGVLIILNGNLYAIPVLGPLTPVLSAMLPGNAKNYNIAREANCNFRVTDGFVITDDFEALTGAFKLVAKGGIDFVNDDIDFTAQARVRGLLPGLVLRPVSELLEFKGDGPVGNPKWRPAFFGIGKNRDANERSQPTKAELDNAAREAGAEKERMTAPKEKPRPLFPFTRSGR